MNVFCQEINDNMVKEIVNEFKKEEFINVGKKGRKKRKKKKKRKNNFLRNAWHSLKSAFMGKK